MNILLSLIICLLGVHTPSINTSSTSQSRLERFRRPLSRGGHPYARQYSVNENAAQQRSSSQINIAPAQHHTDNDNQTKQPPYLLDR